MNHINFLSVTFGDKKMAAEIMKTDCPKTMKKCGRKVTNFDKDVWNKKSKSVVKEGNLAKVNVSILYNLLINCKKKLRTERKKLIIVKLLVHNLNSIFQLYLVCLFRVI